MDHQTRVADYCEMLERHLNALLERDTTLMDKIKSGIRQRLVDECGWPESEADRVIGEVTDSPIRVTVSPRSVALNSHEKED
jgi:hypothetical protein